MRLREIQEILEKNFMKLTIKHEKKSGYSTYIVKNYKTIIKSLLEIEKTNLINREIKNLQDNDLIILSTKEEVTLTSESFSIFKTNVNISREKCIGVLDLINNSFMLESEPEDSLIVSFPSREISLVEMENITQELKITFKLLGYFNCFNYENVKIQDFDKGSNYFVLILGAVAAVELFGKIVFVVQQIRHNNLIHKSLDEQFEQSKLEAEDIRKYNEAIRQINIKIYESYAESIITENELDNNPESISQMTKVIESVNKLQSSGIAFKEGVNSSIEAAENFPPIEQQKHLESFKSLNELKKITNKKDENDI